MAVTVVGLALIVGVVGLLTLLRDRLLAGIDETASARAVDVAALVEAGALPRRFELPGEDRSVVQVVDEKGHLVASTDEGLANLPAVTSDSENPTLFSMTSTEHGVRTRLRVASIVVTTASGRFQVYSAQPRDAADRTIRAVAIALFGGLPVLLGLVGLVTWRSIGRAFAPVHRITNEVSMISEQALSRRVPVPRSQDEIAELATSMNLMLQRVEDAAGRQNRFTADASHELRSPLTSLRTQVEVAAMDPGLSGFSVTHEGLLADLDRLDHLVVDLLALARIDAKSASATPVDLSEIARVEVARRPSGIPVTIQLCAAPLVVQGVIEQLSRAIRNVLDNAQRHARGHIALRLSVVGGMAELEVTDDGQGIEIGDRERVFERFTRLDAARTSDDGGTGLGLAITRSIIEAHGGTIVATDPHPKAGEGARFVISIPTTTLRPC